MDRKNGEHFAHEIQSRTFFMTLETRSGLNDDARHLWNDVREKIKRQKGTSLQRLENFQAPRNTPDPDWLVSTHGS